MGVPPSLVLAGDRGRNTVAGFVCSVGYTVISGCCQGWLSPSGLLTSLAVVSLALLLSTQELLDAFPGYPPHPARPGST